MPTHPLESATYEYGRITASSQLARLTEVVSTGKLGAIGGTQVPELERLAAFRTGRAQALAVASATAGIELACGRSGSHPAPRYSFPPSAGYRWERRSTPPGQLPESCPSRRVSHRHGMPWSPLSARLQGPSSWPT